jgi:membrane dipeptidase
MSTRLQRTTTALTLALLYACSVPAQDTPADIVSRVLDAVPLIDGHNDLPWQYRTRVDNHLSRIDLHDTTDFEPPMHTDLRRLEESGIGGQFWSVYIPASMDGPGAAATVLEQIDVVHRLTEAYPDRLEMAYTADDIVRIHASGKVASLIGMEGGHAIEESLAVLRQLYRAGARYMTLSHSQNLSWVDSATDEAVLEGLSTFGDEVVREMNRLGMLVDLSHVSAASMHDALDITQSPVIFSHSSAFGVTAHPRNVPDDVLERLPDNGGVVMVTFVPPFVSEVVRQRSNEISEQRDLLRERFGDNEAKISQELFAWSSTRSTAKATLNDVADHVDHLRKIAGIDHIGIGSDFDGITTVPDGLEDVSKIPDLLEELVQRGYTEEDLRKICGLNLLRALGRAENVAHDLRGRLPANDVLLGELAGQ